MRGKNKKPILDENGQTVPQFRYDVEYKRADGQTGGWCSQSKYRDLGLGNNTLSSDDLHAEITSFCGDAEPIVGEGYNFRNRAAYVWLKSGDTNVRNGPWTYSGSVSYNPIGGPPDIPIGGPPDIPTGVKAVGGKRALLAFWDSPPGGTPADDYLLQWRTRGSYAANDQAVVENPEEASHLLKNVAGHGRYYVRLAGRNVLGARAVRGVFCDVGSSRGSHGRCGGGSARGRVCADMGPA